MLMTERERMTAEIRALANRFGKDRAALVPILREIKNKYSRINDFSMQVIADELGIHPVEVYSVASFYAFLGTSAQGKFVIRLCRTISCDMQGKDRVKRQLENDLGISFGETTKDGKFSLEWANCMGMCDQGPALLVNNMLHTHVTPEKVHQILEECRQIFGNQPPKRKKVPLVISPLPTYSTMTPEAGLMKALSLEPGEIISEMKASGIKGRGGAGFPTGLKWELAAQATGDRKFILCNADEGEPGTFKDRVILIEHAELVFEGMTIAAKAVGAKEGILFLRDEYAYLKVYLESLLERRRQKKLLGSSILGSDMDFDIRVFMGAGAYVCGEETALIECLEGFRGEPRNRPPFPANAGLKDRPSVVNNVETLASAACILQKGADWWNTQGTEKFAGIKLFSVSGDCAKPGVYEFPLGITVAQLLKDVGGEDAKAVQIGGASGTCVPASEFHRRIAYEDVATGGSVIVLGPHRDMLHVIHNFMDFFVDESCGQCTPCRCGNPKLLEGVEMLQKGSCSMSYLQELCALGETMQIASKCGLGQSSPNAFLSVVKHYRNELMGRTSTNF